MEKQIIPIKIINRFENDLSKNFKFSKKENSNSIISGILNNKALNLWMFSYLPFRSGIKLGETSYFDDVHVNVLYGLSVNFNSDLRKVGIFIGESVLSKKIKLKNLSSFFPNYSDKYNFKGWPSPERFLDQFEYVFSEKDISKYLVEF